MLGILEEMVLKSGAKEDDKYVSVRACSNLARDVLSFSIVTDEN